MKTKKWLIAAVALILIGAILFIGVLFALKWDFLRLSTVNYERNYYDIQEDFQSISIKSDTTDIIFVSTQDKKPSVVCFEDAELNHSVFVENGTLIIQQLEKRNWFDNIGIIMHDPEIKIFLPQQQYDALTIQENTGDIEISKEFAFNKIDITLSTGDVKNYASASDIRIKTTTGDIDTENISADTISISVTTGDTILKNVVCNKLITSGDTGDISFENVIADQAISIERTTGDVQLKGCDGAELFIKTNTGDVTGSLQSEKVFAIQTDTGDIDVPKSVAGGICEITTSTGDIHITID